MILILLLLLFVLISILFSRLLGNTNVVGGAIGVLGGAIGVLNDVNKTKQVEKIGGVETCDLLVPLDNNPTLIIDGLNVQSSFNEVIFRKGTSGRNSANKELSYPNPIDDKFFTPRYPINSINYNTVKLMAHNFLRSTNGEVHIVVKNLDNRTDRETGAPMCVIELQRVFMELEKLGADVVRLTFHIALDMSNKQHPPNAHHLLERDDNLACKLLTTITNGYIVTNDAYGTLLNNRLTPEPYQWVRLTHGKRPTIQNVKNTNDFRPEDLVLIKDKLQTYKVSRKSTDPTKPTVERFCVDIINLSKRRDYNEEEKEEMILEVINKMKKGVAIAGAHAQFLQAAYDRIQTDAAYSDISDKVRNMYSKYVTG